MIVSRLVCVFAFAASALLYACPAFAVADLNGNSVSVLMGRGDGTFRPRQDYPVGKSPRSVTASDFNRDGKTDLAVTYGDSSEVSLVMGAEMLRLETVVFGPEMGGVSPERGWYAPGAVVTLTATPKPGYAFSGWGGNVDGPRSETATITMKADEVVTADFELAPLPEP